MNTFGKARVALAAACALAAIAAALAPSALAASQGTLAIDNCHVKHSTSSGGFSWFYCGIVADAPAKTTVSFTYRVNVATFKPSVGGTWDKGSGSERFTGGGETLWTLKVAVRNLTPAQLRKKLKVTLSDASGATITDGTAVAGGS
jgi:hypothetical protein